MSLKLAIQICQLQCNLSTLIRKFGVHPKNLVSMQPVKFLTFTSQTIGCEVVDLNMTIDY